MTLKSVLDIEINSEAFKRFQAEFNAYNDAVKKQPKLWQQVGASTAALNKQLGMLAASASTVADNSEDAANSQDKFARNVDKSNRNMANLARSSRDVAKGIGGATLALAKWAGMLAGVGSLLAVGGLFGINRMAQGVVDRQNRAAGLGTTSGAEQSFNINVGSRIGGAAGILDAVNAAQHDVGKQSGFNALGLSQKDINGDTVDLALKYLSAAREKFKNTPKGLQGPYMNAFGASGVLDIQQAQQLFGMSDKQFGAMVGGARRDRAGLEQGGGTEAWRGLTMQGQRAELQIGNAFASALAPLAPQLSALSAAIVSVTKKILGSDAFKDGIDKLSGAIHTFADYLTSPDFTQDLYQFMDGIESIGKMLGKITNSDDMAGGLSKLEAQTGVGRKTLRSIEEAGEEGRHFADLSVYRHRFEQIAPEIARLIKGHSTDRGAIGRAATYAEYGYLPQGKSRGDLPADVQRRIGATEVRIINAAGSGIAVQVNGTAAQ